MKALEVVQGYFLQERKPLVLAMAYAYVARRKHEFDTSCKSEGVLEILTAVDSAVLVLMKRLQEVTGKEIPNVQAIKARYSAVKLTEREKKLMQLFYFAIGKDLWEIKIRQTDPDNQKSLKILQSYREASQECIRRTMHDLSAINI